ncbi:imidazolonepropionase, partial [Faecalibacterium sp. An192]|uniref:imidazolonepropionase n=1 Tax=Faecalibacterium sp. An192 TaxID=1965581 RepID=UPI001FA82A59
TRQEIANQLGLSKVQIKNWINRYNRKQTKLEAGIFPKPKGRPRKGGEPGDIIAEQAYEIRRLKMENELLRDFLQSTERK